MRVKGKMWDTRNMPISESDSTEGMQQDDHGPFYEDFRVGQEMRHIGGRTITDADNIWFTLLTCNTNQIHYNKEYTEKYFSNSPFDGRLVVNSLKLRSYHKPVRNSILEIDEERERVNDSCPAVATIRNIASESKLLVLRHLLQGPKGFNELLRSSGINSKTLSATFKSLEENRIVIRKVISTRPFTVRYSLSPAGFDLAPIFEAMGEWGSKWLPQLPQK